MIVAHYAHAMAMLVRVLWALLAGFLLAFAVFEGVKHGPVAAGVLVVFVLVPAAFVRVGRIARVVSHSALLAWVAVVLTSLVPLPDLGLGLTPGLELFLAALAWTLHVTIDRALGGEPSDPCRLVRVSPRAGTW